jgi:hypothetical protein
MLRQLFPGIGAYVFQVGQSEEVKQTYDVATGVAGDD